MSVPGGWLHLAAGVVLCAATTTCPAALDFATERPSDDARSAATWVVEGGRQRRSALCHRRQEERAHLRLRAGRTSSRRLRRPARIGARRSARRRHDAQRSRGQPARPGAHHAFGALLLTSPVTTTRAKTSSGSTTAPPSPSTACGPLRPASSGRLGSIRPTPASTGSLPAASSCPWPSTNRWLRPALGRQRGVVYVLPEASPLQALLGGTRVSARDR